MSDNATLVKRLRDGAEREFACKRFALHAMWVEAADRIAALEAENKHLIAELALENSVTQAWREQAQGWEARCNASSTSAAGPAKETN